jgi:hypothetical protein
VSTPAEIVTVESFTQAMRDAVAERGESYVYPAGEPGWRNDGGDCVYRTPDGAPACLIGLALHKLDPSLVPGHESTDGAWAVFRGLAVAGRVSAVVAERVGVAADIAQTRQDYGNTWGEALDAYLETTGGSTR